MPDLIGLPSSVAAFRIGALEEAADLGISSSWTVQPVIHCGVRPRTVVRQRPAPGTALARDEVVHVRTASMDLDRFRGPCEPRDGDLGPLRGQDAEIARQFYRFAADPGLGAPFVSGEIWVGIEDGPTAVWLDATQRHALKAWGIGQGYAERMGPFSALDLLASSGGYYELHRGITPTCASSGTADGPEVLTGLRAVSLVSPADVVGACMEWWAITLFLTLDDRIAGVALRLGAP